MKRLLAALAMSCAGATAGAAQTPPTPIDDFVASKMADHLLPGVAIIVIRDGNVLHRRGFGELDPAQPIIIGSLSKAIAATAVLRLVDQGKIALDAPMTALLPEVRFKDPAAARITVRHLLNQTSGLPAKAPRAAHADATLAEHVGALADVTLVSPPGERHIYASPNYQILGRIVEVASGQPFGQFVQGSIFKPLDMTSSYVHGADVPNLAIGHAIWWGMPGPSPYAWEGGRLPTASILSSADDLAKFVQAQLGAGPQLLPGDLQAQAHRGVGMAETFQYAMGWREGPTAGVPSLWHGGALPSYRGAIAMMPATRSAVIVLGNSSSMFADPTREIAAGIVSLMHERPVPPGQRTTKMTYAFILAASLLLFALAVRSLLRAATRTDVARPGKVVFFDVAVPLALAAFLPRLFGISHRDAWHAAPDLVVTTAVLVALSLASAAFKLRNAKRRPAAPFIRPAP